MDEDTVNLPINGTLDLHAFAPRDVPEVVDAYIEACLESGIHEIRIVHGKGIGTQKRIVESILRTDPRVLSFTSGGFGNGGWGATMAQLRKIL